MTKLKTMCNIEGFATRLTRELTMEIDQPRYDGSEGFSIGGVFGQGREVVLSYEEVVGYEETRSSHRAITFDGTESLPDVIRLFRTYQRKQNISEADAEQPKLELFVEPSFGFFAFRKTYEVIGHIDITSRLNYIVFVETRNTKYVFMNRNGKVRGQAYKTDGSTPNFLATPTDVRFHSFIAPEGHMVFTPECDGKQAGDTITTSRVQSVKAGALEELVSA